MAIFKMVSGSGKYQDDLAIPNLIAYITNGNKAKGDIIGGCNIDFNNIAGSMVQVSEHIISLYPFCLMKFTLLGF